MNFTKMHGCGNDYVYVDLFHQKITQPSRLARAVSDRHTGVGSDGLILIAPSRKADFRMIMFNADGSRGEMCGNGIRCVGKYVYEHGLTRRKNLTIETAAGIVRLMLHGNGKAIGSVTVDMGAPRPVPQAFHIRANGVHTVLRERIREMDCFVVSMGNPHCVIPVSSTENAMVSMEGPRIERHGHFPSRTNVEFVEILSRSRVRQRTWERGSGETLACGTGACAVTVALASAGRTHRRVRVDLLGGSLEIDWRADGHVYMTGPAVEIFSGAWPTTRRQRR